MNSISVVLSVALVALLSVCHGHQSSSSSSARTWPIESYLGRPVHVLQAAAFDYIRAMIDEKDLNEPEEILAFLKETNEQLIEKKTIAVQFNGETIMIGSEVEDLIQLAAEDTKVSDMEANIFIKIIEHVFGDVRAITQSTPPPHDVALFNYLRNYGLKKYPAVASNLNDEHERIMRGFDKNTEKVLDLFVSSHDNNKRAHRDDEYLTRLATNIDLVNGQFDAKKLLKLAKASDAQIFADTSFLISTFDTMCSGLLDAFRNLLDVLNTIRLLRPESLSEVGLRHKLVKFNEYSRVCHQLAGNVTSEQVKANIHDGLQSSLSKLFKKLVN